MDRTLASAVERGEPPRRIAGAMHLTEDSVRWRIKHLGRSLREGWRSRQEVAATLGVGRRAVDRWMREGRLAVERHGTRWTRVADDELRTFVRRHAGTLLRPEAIDDQSLRRLAETSAVANRRRSGVVP